MPNSHPINNDIMDTLTPLVLTCQKHEEEKETYAKITSDTSSGMKKFDPKDTALDSLLDNNRRWAAAVMKEDPNVFSDIAEKQSPKILWIGM
jgi:carbonic anhydrase